MVLKNVIKCNTIVLQKEKENSHVYNQLESSRKRIEYF